MKQGPRLVLFYKKLSENDVVGPCFLGLLLYISGFVVFAYEGLAVFYLKQWWIPLIIGGVSWVSLMVTLFFRRQKGLYPTAIANFDIEPDHSEKLLESFFRQISNDLRIIFFTIPWAVVIILYVLLACAGVVSVPQEIVENLLQNVLLLTYSIFLGFIAAYHVGIGSYIAVKHIQFVHSISKFPLKTTPLEIRHGKALQDLSRFSILGSATWFVDVGIAIVLIITIVDIITVAMLAILTVIGLLILLLPQIYLRGSILRYKDNVQSQIVEKFRVRWRHLDENLGGLDLITLCELSDQIESIEEWPFGRGRTIKQILATLIPLASSIIGFVFRAVI